jgi:multimeric flavodoxin WrbA
MPAKIAAVVGSYRRGCVIDSAVDEMLAEAKAHGAEVTKIFLLDKKIEFCTNCRACMQMAGDRRGECAIKDEMSEVLDVVEAADAIVLASPMNFGTVTAVMKRFIERLACYGYWPWGQMAPKTRKALSKRAVLVTSSAAPAVIGRLSTKIIALLKQAAKTIGAKPVGVLYIGMATPQQKPVLREGTKKEARALGKKLAEG